MGRCLVSALLLAAGLALAGCGHTSPLEGTPWIWSNRWRAGEAPAPAEVVVERPLRVAASQPTIAGTVESAPAEPTVTEAPRAKPKRKSNAKRRKRSRR